MKRTPQIRRLRWASTVPRLLTFCAFGLAPACFGQASPSVSTAPAATAPINKPPSDRQKTQAAEAYSAGARMLERRDYAASEKQFARARQLDPENRDYEVAFAMAHEHHVTDLVQQAGRERLLGHADQAAALVEQARLLDPRNEMVLEHSSYNAGNSPLEPRSVQDPVLAGAIELTPAPVVKSFRIHADEQQVLRTVANDYGIRAVFDDSVTHQDLRFELADVSYDQVMPVLLHMTHLFAVPLDSTSVLLARDTAENRQRLERQLQETIYVPAMTTEQMSDLGNVVRNIFDVKQATVENSLGNLVIRAPQDTIKAVNLTLADLLDGGSEVLLDLKLYSVAITHGRTTGVSLPSQFGAYNVASQAQALVTANQTLVNEAIAQGLISSTASVLQIAEYLIASGVATSTLLSSTFGIFGGGITTTGVYATGSATLNFGLTASDARAVDEIQLRVGDRQAADFRIGTRYPITTATYTSSSAALASSLAGVTINGVSAASLLATATSVTVPQIQYEDLGLVLKATPYVTKAGSVNLKLDMKIESLAGGSIDGIPILTSRQVVSDITVKDGEAALLLSNASRSETRAIDGVPGLSELPGVQDVSSLAVEADTSQLVLVLTPHIVRKRTKALYGPRVAFTPSRTSN